MKEDIQNIYTDVIRKSNLIIADVTGLEPNIIYEIGYGRALNKQIIFLIEENSEYIPYFLKGDMLLVYNRSDKNKLNSNLELSIKNFILKEILW